MDKPDLDPYAVLGVPRNATAEEIKAAYRALVAKYHPDRHQGNPLEELAARKLAEINRAYEILSDPQRRAAYDAGQAFGPRPRSPFGNGPFAGGRKPGRTWAYAIGLLLLMPLLLRMGVFLVRMLARAFRMGATSLAAARGTPVLLAVVVVGVALALVVFFRRRRR